MAGSYHYELIPNVKDNIVWIASALSLPYRTTLSASQKHLIVKLLCGVACAEQENRTSAAMREASPRRLNRFIRDYETLSYDKEAVLQSHHRAKRSVTNPNSAVHLQFKAHSRTFNLRLKRDLNTFADNLVIVDSHGSPLSPSQADTAHIYSGHLVGEPESLVFGSLLDGVFDGQIISPSMGTYYVEKASKYFPPEALKSNNTNQGFHSIVYKESDVDDLHEDGDPDHPAGCGITDEMKQWMESIQTSAVEDDSDAKPSNGPRTSESRLMPAITPKKKLKKAESTTDFANESPSAKYTKEWNSHSGDYSSSRHKREAPKKDAKDKKSKDAPRPMNTCALFIQTDPLLWKHIAETMDNDPERTREEILSLIAHHVTAVNYIYRDTKFDGKMEHRNIKFEVQRIKIDEYSVCHKSYKGPVSNPFCMENIDVSNFLNLHSLGNHDDFCLAYVFTYRDFTGGTLGLAWVASASGASGGICEKYKSYTETVGGIYQSTKRSLNTGIITFVNYNARVPPKVSQLTLAHEIGHNFGSPHDYPPECRPGGMNGNFIMFASATSGDRPNNSKFSPCSIGNISSVLDVVRQHEKRNCFQASEGAFCGNKIVEEGEECDCGYDNGECVDHCCYPRNLSQRDIDLNRTAKACARRVATECSPSQGPCCYANNCKFIPYDKQLSCRSESECTLSSFCNGISAECPAPLPKSNKTRCNEGTQLCLNGECRGSICLEWGLNECFLSSNSVPAVDKRKLCELACMNGTNTEKCQSTSEFASSVGLPPGGISLRPGSPCDNFQGYCDVFFKCRAVDAEGPLARLKNLLLTKRTLILQWAFDNWWACVLMAVIFIFFLGAFIKCCAVHTPSSNPKKPPARRLRETLQQPIHTLQRMRGRRGPSGDRGYRGHDHHHRSRQHGAASSSHNQSSHMNNYRAPPPYSRSQQQYSAKPSAPRATRADVYLHPDSYNLSCPELYATSTVLVMNRDFG
ncbi:hypothetical protein V9T40_009170 [Parthenolecanium corni]|uniref:ADAM10 endopeptidase n=1 Tax=Parthenolecanium corni TaxID=536013 RepID=A0AAN9Y7W0_9HEMI